MLYTTYQLQCFAAARYARGVLPGFSRDSENWRKVYKAYLAGLRRQSPIPRRPK
jgi:hypothetical protein